MTDSSTDRSLTLQEAQLFSGSIRENLDPFQQHEDLELWEVLRQCGMASRNTPGVSRVASQAVSRVGSVQSQMDHKGSDASTVADEAISIKSLDERVAKGGANFSAGQRQLLALARGMLKLKYSSILVLDESTANLGESMSFIASVAFTQLQSFSCRPQDG